MRNILLIAFIPLMVLAGCKREHIELYSGTEGINFWHYNHRLPTQNYYQADSIMYSFLENDFEQDTVWVLVQAMGEISDVDRPISVKQVNTGETRAAVAGKHYKAFSDISQHYYMPAGEVLTWVPVVLLRDETLGDEEYKLVMEIVPNEYFHQGVVDYLRFTVLTSDMLVKPDGWDTNWRMAFGTWSRVKMQFLIDYVTGRIDWDVTLSFGAQYGYKSLAYIKWLEYVDEHGPLIDENGVEIVFTVS